MYRTRNCWQNHELMFVFDNSTTFPKKMGKCLDCVLKYANDHFSK